MAAVLAGTKLEVDKQYSFETSNYPGFYISHQEDGFGVIASHHDSSHQDDAVFIIKTGLADGDYISLESKDKPKWFFRHENYWVRLAQSTDPLFREDASFKVVPALTGEEHCVSFQSYNYQNRYIRHSYSKLRVDENDNSDLFKKDATFRIVDMN